jgi:uncharacterized protein
MNGKEAFPYTETEVALLEALLFDEAGEDALDLFGLHGLLSALQIFPGIACMNSQLLAVVAGDLSNLDKQQQASLGALVLTLAVHIGTQLNTEDGFILPTEVYDDEDALISWASAFMEGVFMHEDAWFTPNREEQSASLLLPIMAHSLLYDTDEFLGIQQNTELMVSLMEQIPEVVIDLHLLMNTEK